MSNNSSKLSRRESREAASEFIYNLKGQPFPNSKKIYVDGEQEGVRVGMREISLNDSFVGGTEEEPIYEKMNQLGYMIRLVLTQILSSP